MHPNRITPEYSPTPRWIGQKKRNNKAAEVSDLTQGAKPLNRELREIHKDLSIHDDVKLPPLTLLFNYITREGFHDNREFLYKGSQSFGHIYFAKREEYKDGVIFLINDGSESLKSDAIKLEIARVVKEIFKSPGYHDLKKIIAIPLKVDSLTNVLITLDTEHENKSKKDTRIRLPESVRDIGVEVGQSQIFYHPEYKKNHSTHTEPIFSQVSKKLGKTERVRPLDLFVYNFNKNRKPATQEEVNPVIKEQVPQAPPVLKKRNLPVDLNLLTRYISGSSQELKRIDIDRDAAVDCVLQKRPEYGDGIIFCINHGNQQSLKPSEIKSKIAPVVNKIFEKDPELGKIIIIPLKVDSLSDVLKILKNQPKTKEERDARVALVQSKLKIGASQTLYPEHKKNYSNHVELVLRNLFTEFKKIEQISREYCDLFVYVLNEENQKLIVDLRDASKPVTQKEAVNSAMRKQLITALQDRYKDAPLLKISTNAQKDLHENFQIEDYEVLGSKKTPELYISAMTDKGLYNLRLNGKREIIKEITDSKYFQDLKTKFENFLPEDIGDRGEKITEALFKHFGANTELMSSKPGHRYDLKIHVDKNTNSPLKLLQDSPHEIHAEIKTSKDDSPSIRNLTINQVTRFQELRKNKIAVIAKVVLNDNAEHSFIKTEEIFKDYPPKFIENENGFAVLKPDPEISKDLHSPYSKIYLFTFDALQGKNKDGKLKAPATISKLELSVNLKEVETKIAESKGKVIDLNTLGSNATDSEKARYFNNFQILREIEQKLTKVNNHQHFASEGFAKTFMYRDELRKEREETMKKLFIAQLTSNNPFPNLELIEYYSPSLKKVPSITTSNPDINKNIFVFKNKETGEIKPYEIMFFSQADPVQQCTLDRLSNRNISNDSNGNDISKLPVRVAFYDGKDKIHVLKEDLPEKVLERLGAFKDLKNVRKGVHDPEDNLFTIEPIALHLRPEIMLNHSFA
jgi:hypothetical protein